MTRKTSQRNSSKDFVSAAYALLPAKMVMRTLAVVLNAALDYFRTIVGKVDHHGAIPNHKLNTA